jgi:phosphoribosylformimino-5-aminoimidazole carboxamide ribotide isomerase
VTIYPAIDLKGGKCVRLHQGDMAQATVYGDDPVAMAWRWEAEGGEWLHVVDLDGAIAGRPEQLGVVAEICSELAIPVELGGGLRREDHARAALAVGVTRVVLGTVALEDPALVERLCREFPDRVVVALDARGGKVAVKGWTETTAILAVDAARGLADRGVAAILFTDISRDGTGRGVNVEATARLADGLGIPVIASGGVASIDDVRRVKAVEARGVEGVVVGRALYTGAVRLAEAIAISKGAA